jgi:6-phosphogluconolactonase/glucosamine-6-phosphate isomerase/deaminase
MPVKLRMEQPMNFSIRVCDDTESMSRKAAERVLDVLAGKPDLLLCAAGGSTPLRTYQLLAEHHAREPEAFRLLRVVKLDEWGGIAMDDPGACENQLRTLLIDPLGLPDDRYFGFRSDRSDPEAECERIHTVSRPKARLICACLGWG